MHHQGPKAVMGGNMRTDAIVTAAAEWVEELAARWQENPRSLPQAWQEYFASQHEAGQQAERKSEPPRVPPEIETSMRIATLGAPITTDGRHSLHHGIEYPSRAIYLIHAWRVYGHTQAQLDPLGMTQPQPRPELELAYYGLSQRDLDTVFPTGDMPGPEHMPLREIMRALRRTYAGHLGPELMHLSDSARKHWLHGQLEGCQSQPKFDRDTREAIYASIMRAEEFERFLHTRYMGQKRFSLEGGESLIPMLNLLIQQSGEDGVKEIILGMAHRGRLNVLANVLRKSLTDIFAEFNGAILHDAVGQGDVKYHMGFSSDIRTKGGTVHLSLAFNPSHLEVISPVVMGSVRARQCRRKDAQRRQVMGVLIHGDAAFSGQGVVAETLNLGGLSGYRTGGTIHIVINNQIGFTTNPFDARSTLYCTDIAKMVQAPILHVNGDDPEACCLAMQLALQYRMRFRSDVVIDLVCYRRHGHNEADAPEVTQPMMYQRIAKHPTTLSLYERQLIQQGVMEQRQADEQRKRYRDCLQRLYRTEGIEPHAVNTLQGRWAGYRKTLDKEPETAVDAKLLRDLAHKVHTFPKDFHPAKQVERIYRNRIRMMDGVMPVDWGCAETMAYATLVHEGGWVRLSGQDSGRGTFFHRHAIIYDQRDGHAWMPLRQVERGRMSHFLVVDSMLSEMAVLGFEYGYAVAEPRALVIWEAQYGDFANNAQVVIDQFIAAGESKWQRMCGMVLWLPHGYEGQGAEHSSARLERYLQLCAEDNMQVVYPTTAAQLFHLLRRQLRMRMRKPLILMGPKSLLRNKASFSKLEDFTHGSFRPIIGETQAEQAARDCRLLILCTGKVYYDLVEERAKSGMGDVAIVRIERLYPFPRDELRALLSHYPHGCRVRWVQEEPRNQGAWYQIKHHLQACLKDGYELDTVTRPSAASPAVGSAQRHQREQQTLVETALRH